MSELGPVLIEIMETELMSLHEGNIARYWVLPTEYTRWREAWGQSPNG
jgi:hypothetical protein